MANLNDYFLPKGYDPEEQKRKLLQQIQQSRTEYQGNKREFGAGQLIDFAQQKMKEFEINKNAETPYDPAIQFYERQRGSLGPADSALDILRNERSNWISSAINPIAPKAITTAPAVTERPGYSTDPSILNRRQQPTPTGPTGMGARISTGGTTGYAPSAGAFDITREGGAEVMRPNDTTMSMFMGDILRRNSSVDAAANMRAMDAQTRDMAKFMSGLAKNLYRDTTIDYEQPVYNPVTGEYDWVRTIERGLDASGGIAPVAQTVNELAKQQEQEAGTDRRLMPGLQNFIEQKKIDERIQREQNAALSAIEQQRGLNQIAVESLRNPLEKYMLGEVKAGRMSLQDLMSYGSKVNSNKSGWTSSDRNSLVEEISMLPKERQTEALYVLDSAESRGLTPTQTLISIRKLIEKQAK